MICYSIWLYNISCSLEKVRQVILDGLNVVSVSFILDIVCLNWSREMYWTDRVKA